ncbi:MAG: hypothetical protein FJW40_14670, partial [Acidobacteria bacterium]|nr:hypothetical protein [Acidobacteriota bacterium]
MQPASDHYPIVTIKPEWVLEEEAMGSKRKFWFRQINSHADWLFKYPQANTGQHWAEKVAAEIAGKLEVLHARVELASFDGVQGSATESFARQGRELYHGNQVLAGQVLDYNLRLSPGLRQRVKTLLAVRCKIIDRQISLIANWRHPVKRRRALLESNPPRDSRCDS